MITFKPNEFKGNLMSEIAIKKYELFLNQIIDRIQTAKEKTLRSVNKKLLGLYWDIGKHIVLSQNKEGWGQSIVEKLAKDLQVRFPGIRGYSSRNLWNMRNYYLTYESNEKLQRLSAEISWSHNCIIMTKCKEQLEREFYLKMSRQFDWSMYRLQDEILSQTYEKTMLNQTNFKKTLPKKNKHQAMLSVKDEYCFDFLDLAEEYSEKEFELAVLSKVGPFLREMGGMFTFVGNQYRLEVSDHDFFIDLLLYHRNLKCLVALELKKGEFLPEYAGKMQFYLSALNEKARLEGENPAIGIILCKSKDRTIVEYTLKDTKKPIGVACYETVKKLPKDLKKELPKPDQIEKLLDFLK